MADKKKKTKFAVESRQNEEFSARKFEKRGRIGDTSILYEEKKKKTRKYSMR